MSKDKTVDDPVDPKAEAAAKARARALEQRAEAVGNKVLSMLGRPPGFRRVTATPITDRTFRVNVYVQKPGDGDLAEIIAIGISDSFLVYVPKAPALPLPADARENIGAIVADPPIPRRKY